MSKKRLKISQKLQKFRETREIPTKTSKNRQNTDKNVEKPSKYLPKYRKTANNRQKIVENR